MVCRRSDSQHFLKLDIIMSADKGRGAWINGEVYKRPERLGQDAIELVATADPYRFRMEKVGHLVNDFYTSELKARTYPDALGYYMLFARIRQGLCRSQSRDLGCGTISCDSS